MRLPLLLTAAVLLAAPAAAQPAPPKLKAGLWEQTTNLPGVPPPYNSTKSTFCVNDAVQQQWSAFGQSGAAAAGCGKSQVRQAPTGWSFTQTCQMGGRPVTTTGTVRGDFNTGYTMEARSTGMPGGASGFSSQSRYLGAACGGLKPGQMKAMGMTIDMTKGMAAPR